jgi:hypothetical protein
VADWVANIAKGKVKYYCELPAASDALIIVPLEATGLEADATAKDYDDLGALIAGSSNEQTTMGRKTVTASIVITVDDTNDRVDIDMPDITWLAATGNPTGAVLICYDGDTGAGTDSNITVLTKHDFTTTPDGTDLTATIASSGIYRAAG